MDIQNSVDNGKKSVEEFLNQFDNYENDFDYADYIVAEYVPVLQKKLVLTNLLKASVVEDNIMPYIDVVNLEINRLLCILILYTNLDVEGYVDENSVYDLYDEFCRRDISETDFCDEKEYVRLLNIESDLVDNWMKYNQSVVSLIGKYKTQLAVYLEEKINELNQQLPKLDNDMLQQIIGTVQSQDSSALSEENV